MIFSGAEIVDVFVQLGITHVIWIPDTVIGCWESSLEASTIDLIRVCREGEAWPLAAGLFLGGKKPIVLMQTTGLFESGDALRNVLMDLNIPLFALIGARNWLDSNSNDSAKTYAEPIFKAWNLDYAIIQSAEDKPKLAGHYRKCCTKRQAGIVVLAE